MPTKRPQLSPLALHAYTLGHSALQHSPLIPLTITLLSNQTHPTTTQTTQPVHPTNDLLHAIYYNQATKRWTVIMFRSGIPIAGCPTRKSALTLLGLCYLDPYLSQISHLKTYTDLMHYHKTLRNSTPTINPPAIISTAYRRAKCCTENNLSSLT